MFGVSLKNYRFDQRTLTFNVTGGATAADVGKPVALDTTAANSVKLAADDDVIFGRLDTFEDRTQDGTQIGGIQLAFTSELTPSAAYTTAGPAVGDKLVSAGNGEVKALAAPTGLERTTVVEVLSNGNVVALHNV